jgi:nitroimidazol reductase NimA-like FMN-containing flavoprotein (pyridoxamine 5'-phosphate oxidase superfamily)
MLTCGVPMPTAELLILSENECRELLGSVEIGRVVTSVEALPAAFPVNFRVVDSKVVFRTRAGAKLDAALNHTVVGFEVDDVDEAGGSAWSVLVIGRSEVVTDPATVAELDRHDIRSWAGAELPHYVLISIDRLTGRRVPGPVDR